jgi:hypothetical protein
MVITFDGRLTADSITTRRRCILDNLFSNSIFKWVCLDLISV